MGLKEAKYMIMIITVVLFITNVFSGHIAVIAGVGENITPYISNVYDTNTGQLASNGTQYNAWISQNETLTADSGILDFTVKSWTWIKNGIITIFNFTYAPYVLVKAFVSIDGSRSEYLNWLPALIGIMWTMALVFTGLQILWKE